MKISIDELDNSVKNKINKFDKLELNYAEDNGQIVMFNGKEYYTSNIEIPRHNIEHVYFSNNSINDFRKALYKSHDNFKSSFDTIFTESNLTMSNFRNAYSEINSNFICMADSDILLFKEFGNYYYTYLESGKIFKINKSNITVQTDYDIMNVIRTNFVCPNIKNTDVLDFIVVNNAFLISTVENGIFYMDFNKNEFELKFNLNQVIKLLELPNKNILCISDIDKNSIVTYDLESGNKIETSNVIRKRDYQVAKDAILMDNGDFAVLGKPIGINPCEHLLHYWRMDFSKASYENEDIKIHPNKASVFYEVKFLSSFSKNIVISGVYKSKLFIWVYDTDNLKNTPREIIFDKLNIEYDDLQFVHMKSYDEIYFNIADKLLMINANGDILANIKMNQYGNISKMLCSENKIIGIDRKEALHYNITSYNYYPEIKLLVFNDPIACNNIDIYIKSNNGKDRVTFYDPNTNEQIRPSYYGITEFNETVINISDCKSTKIVMKINSPKDNEIYGVVVNKNRLFKK